MAVLAHPDDESLGFGGTLATYVSAGVETSLVTATRGERGRFHGKGTDDSRHPGPVELGKIREAELRAAASTLGIRDVSLLGYHDGDLDQADPKEAAARIAEHVKRIRPHVVVTFGPEGAYGHPDHIAICQFTTAAVLAAAPSHAVSKLYYLEWPEATWAAYQEAFKTLGATVDGVSRKAAPWPDWSITTVVDTRACWPTVWRAVSCHQSQIAAYERLKDLTPVNHEALWGRQSFYRVFSTVNGGRKPESDLFEGIEP